MLCCLAVQLQALRIGVTTKDPDSGFMPGWAGIDFSDHYWFVYIRSDGCKVQHKRAQTELQWVLDRSAGNIWLSCVRQRRALSSPQWEGCGCGLGRDTHLPTIVGICDPTWLQGGGKLCHSKR